MKLYSSLDYIAVVATELVEMLFAVNAVVEDSHLRHLNQGNSAF